MVVDEGFGYAARMDFIAKFLAKPSTVIWLVVTLFILALTFSLKFRRVVRSSKLLLKAATTLLDGVVNRSDFANQYLEIADRISVAFSKNRPLSQQWKRFQTQLTRGEDGTIFSYRQPDEFFNSTSLLKDRWLPLCKAGPSYLVGIGLVFTFLGIAVVIYRASLALGSSNDLQALRDLLGAASLKFWTSLVGVALSVITSGYFRHLTARFNVATSDFSYALSRRVSFLSQEYSLQMTNIYLSRQVEALHELRTAVLQREEESSDKIVKELQSLQKGMISVTENTFSELVEKSTSELSSAITNSLRDVANTFVSINIDLKLIMEQVQQLPNSFRSLSQEVNHSSLETAGQIQGAGRVLMDDLGKAKIASSEIAAEFAQSSDCANRIRISLDSLPDAIAKVTESLSRLSALQDVSQKLHEAAAAIRASSDALVVNWQQQADHVSSIDQKLGHTVATLPTVFTQYSESLQKFTEEFDSHLGSVLGSLATQVESLESSQDSLRGIAEALHASLNNGSSTRPAEAL